MQIQKPLLFDGAFGTYYFSLTGDREPCELACLNNPDTVLRIHKEYLAAGATAITTNTFAANPQMQDVSLLPSLLKAAYSIATEATINTNAIIFADIGGIMGVTAEQDYLQIVKLFFEIGAKAFIFETLAEFEPLLPAIEWLKNTCPDVIIYVSFAVSADGYSRKGLYYRTLLSQASNCSTIDATGLNCLCGPAHMLSLLQKLPPISKPLIAMPNAGYPSSLNGRLYFEDNADYFAQRITEMYAHGANILGGCCGTTPQHIALTAKALENFKASSHLIIAVELDPPQTSELSPLLKSATKLMELGIDWITVADSPLARAKMDSIMASAKIQRETGAHVLPHLSCRDRSSIGIKAALLGAAMENIHDILIITGDSPADGGGVFDFHAASLMRYVSELNSSFPKQFHMAGALNINACSFSIELERAKTKLQNGASMLLTQPIFSEQAFENLRLARKELDCTLLAGILPLAGYKNALFLSNEVTGIVIPPSLLENLRLSPPDIAKNIAVDFAADIAKKCLPFIDGFYIMTPLGKIDIVCALLERIHQMRNEENYK